MGNAKPATLRAYDSHIRNHIRPGLGAVRLTELHPHTVQNFINSLDGLSPTSVRLVYTVLRTALEKAIDLDYIPRNPAAKCVLPKQERKEIKPLDDAQATALIRAAAGTRIENMIPLALFTGLRISELLGLTWSAVDMDRGTITVDKQLSAKPKAGALFSSPKSGKSRTITPAPTAFQVLRRQKARQAEQQLKAGPLWSNPHGLIFTAEDGGPLSQQMAELNFSDVRATVGLEGTRFHDLRHTYAVNSIRAGDDIKTIQTNLGHASAAFTLDIYGHVTEAMKQDSATRMEVLIKSTINL